MNPGEASMSKLLSTTLSRTLFAAAFAGMAAFAGTAGAQDASKMSFFITSAGPGKGADLGGLEGADRHCADAQQDL